jgi:formiminoglutamase
MKSKLPFIISIPHGGSQIPEELLDRICLSQKDLFDDIDSFTHDIFDLGESVEHTIKANIASSFVDLNGSEDNLISDLNGIIKNSTCYNQPIYEKGKEPKKQLINKLLKKYYHPYYGKIKELTNQNGIRFGFDCHSMINIAPPISADPGSKRPIINIGNCNGKSCSNDLVEKLAHCFKEVFHLRECDITINKPFAGGQITTINGNNPIPWIHIDINKSLYLAPAFFNRNSLKVTKKRLTELNKLIELTLYLFNQHLLSLELQLKNPS